MDDTPHPVAIDHLPFFITGPGQTDVLFNVMVAFMLVAVLVVGNLYFQLHAVPERMAHRTNRVQMEIVAVLGLIALFTHNHLFWIAALLLAMIQFPDFFTPVASIASSLERMAGGPARTPGPTAIAAPAPPGPGPEPLPDSGEYPHPDPDRSPQDIAGAEPSYGPDPEARPVAAGPVAPKAKEPSHA